MENKNNYIHYFISFEGEQYRFYVHTFPEKEIISMMIQRGYGIVDEEPGGEYTLELASPDYDPGDREVYSVEYIIACNEERKSLNIKDYRLNKISKYNSDFEPMSVLEHFESWSEAQKYRIVENLDESMRKKTSYSSLSSSENYENEDEITSVQTRHEFDYDNFVRNVRDSSTVVVDETRNEERFQIFPKNSVQVDHAKIIECIVEHKAYNLLHGKDFWRMLEEQVWKNRKWYYLKHTFFEKILPNIESYNLNENETVSFRSVKIGVYVSKEKSSLEEEKENEENIMWYNEKEKGDNSRWKSRICYTKSAKCKNCSVNRRKRNSLEVYNEEEEENVSLRNRRTCNDKNKPCLVIERKRNESQNSLEVYNEREKEDVSLRKSRSNDKNIPCIVKDRKQNNVSHKSLEVYNEEEDDDDVSLRRRRKNKYQLGKENESRNDVMLLSEEGDQISNRKLRKNKHQVGKENETRNGATFVSDEEEEQISERHSSNDMNHNENIAVCIENQKQNENEDGDDDMKPKIFKSRIKYYTEKEDRAILDFIISREWYHRTGGVLIWKLMEKKKVIPGRTWQSMKERYRKILVNKLDKYLPKHLVKKIKESELRGNVLMERSKIRVKPNPSSPIKISKNFILTNHKPGLKCTCCFDFDTDKSGIESESFNKNSGTPLVINSKNSLSKSSDVTLDVNKSNKLNSSMLVKNVSKENKNVQINRKVPKRKLFTQNESFIEITPMSDDEKIVYKSKNPQKLFDKKINGKIQIKNPVTSNVMKEKPINKSTVLVNGISINKETTTKLNSRNFDNITKNSEDVNIIENNRVRNAQDEKESNSQILNEKLIKAVKQVKVNLVDSNNLLQFKHTAGIIVPLEAKGDENVRNKYKETEEVPNANVNLTNNDEILVNNNKDKNKTTAGETAMNTETEEIELVSSLFNLKECALHEGQETQKIFGSTFSNMLVGGKIGNKMFQQKKPVINEEKNANNYLGSKFEISEQINKENSEEVCSVNSSQSKEMLEINTTPNIQVNASNSNVDINLTFNSCENIPRSFEEEINYVIENSLNSSITENTSQLQNDDIQTNMEKLAEDNISAYGFQNREMLEINTTTNVQDNASNSNVDINSTFNSCENIPCSFEEEINNVIERSLNSIKTENTSQQENDKQTNMEKLAEDNINAHGSQNREMLEINTAINRQDNVSNSNADINLTFDSCENVTSYLEEEIDNITEKSLNSSISENISQPQNEVIQTNMEKLPEDNINTEETQQSDIICVQEKNSQKENTNITEENSNAVSIVHNDDTNANITDKIIAEENTRISSEENVSSHEDDSYSLEEEDESAKESDACEVSDGSSLSIKVSSLVDKDSNFFKFSHLQADNPHCTLDKKESREIHHTQVSEISDDDDDDNGDGNDDGSHFQYSIQTLEEKSKFITEKSFKEINFSHIRPEMEDKLNSSCFDEKGSTRIDMTDENISSVVNSGCENTCVKSENDSNINTIPDNSKKHEEKFHSSCESEIIEKTKNLNIENHISKFNCDSENNPENEEQLISSLKNIYTDHISIIESEYKSEDELTDHLKNYIQQLYDGNFKYTSESKYEILDHSQKNVLLEIISDSEENLNDDINYLNDKIIISGMNIDNETIELNSKLLHPVNTSYFNGINSLNKNMDQAQRKSSNETDISNELIKFEPGMGDIDVDNHLADITECTKQNTECSELSEANKFSFDIKNGSCEQEDILLNDEVKKLDFLSVSNHLSEDTCCAKEESPSNDLHSSKITFKYKIKSKKFQNSDKDKISYTFNNPRQKKLDSAENTGKEETNILPSSNNPHLSTSCPEGITFEQLVASDKSYCNGSSSSSYQETSSPEYQSYPRKGVRQCLLGIRTYKNRKKNTSSHSYGNKVVMEAGRSSSNSSPEILQQFMDSSSAFSSDSKNSDIQMSSSESLYKCSTAKKKKVKNDDNLSVCDSGLGMEPWMDEVVYSKTECHKQYDKNKECSGNEAVYNLPANNYEEKEGNKYRTPHCIIS